MPQKIASLFHAFRDAMPQKKGLTAHKLQLNMRYMIQLRNDMPQTTSRGVAPLNPQPRWPGGYLTVLQNWLKELKTQLNLLIYKITLL